MKEVKVEKNQDYNGELLARSGVMEVKVEKNQEYNGEILAQSGIRHCESDNIEEKHYITTLPRPSSKDSLTDIVDYLMLFNKSSDEEFSRKAIESLMRKLRRKKDELDALIACCGSKGKEADMCVTITRTLDGRLQIAGRKVYPHVVYARVFRWPDLHKNEVRHLGTCEFAFELKCRLVCVNPYHCERVSSSSINHIYSLELGSLKTEQYSTSPELTDSDAGQLSEPYRAPQERDQAEALLSEAQIAFDASYVYDVTPIWDEAKTSSSMLVLNALPDEKMDEQQPYFPHHQIFDDQIQTNHNAQYSEDWMTSSQQHIYQEDHFFEVQNHHHHIPSSLHMQNSPSLHSQDACALHVQQFESTSTESSALNPPQQDHQHLHSSLLLDNAVELQLTPTLDSNQSAAVPSNLSNDEDEELPWRHPFDQAYSDILNAASPDRKRLKVDCSEPPSCSVDSNWGCFVYYEGKMQISRLQVSHSNMYIDGGFEQLSYRYSLGREKNPFRDPYCHVVRQTIGNGIRLSYKDNGDVWVHVYTGYAIFVHSHYLDQESGRDGADVVYKVYPGTTVKIFDLYHAKTILRKHTVECQVAKECLTEQKPLLNISRECTRSKLYDEEKLTRDELKRYCVARISFVEGWGADHSRRTIGECPCWIEVEMNRALQYLEELLHEM